MPLSSDMLDIWDKCLKEICNDIPENQLNTWIKPLSIDFEKSSIQNIYLNAPNRFVLEWVQYKYLSQIKEAIQKIQKKVLSVEVSLAPPQKNNLNTPLCSDNQESIAFIPKEPIIQNKKSNSLLPMDPLPGLHNLIPPSEKENSQSTPSKGAKKNQEFWENYVVSSYEKTHLNRQLTFEELVRGKANELAHAAAKQVAEKPGQSYNPLFIYGGVGLGKTHLLQAVGNTALNQNPKTIVRYIHANDYYADVVKAYQQGSFDTFAKYYRSLDLLLIDDIQFFNNKTRTQEEFFHVFNALIEAKRQIIITCDTYPKDISGLNDRLISRFDWGLTVAIDPPELEMRVAILKKKAEAEGIILNEGVSFFIAKHLKSNVRELEGALNKVLAFARFHSKDITLEITKEALKDLLHSHNKQITIDLIQKTVADYFKIKVADLYSKKRTINIARPRQIAMTLSRELTPASLPHIGEAFGGRDHTTVLHACRHINLLKNKEPQIGHAMHVLTQTLKN